MTVQVTQELAAFAVATHHLEPASEVLESGRQTIANAVGVGVGGSDRPAVDHAMSALGSLQLPASGTLLGRRERLSPTWAAFVNGIAIHVDDYDDTHLPTFVHPGAPVVAAALAAGELTGASGEELLIAVIVGVEIAVRVGQGLRREHFDRGWHLTGTAGHFGAAAAAGRLLGLSSEQMAAALGIAATQAAGLQAALGTMTKPLHPGKAAANGIEGALLAMRGFTGPPTGIEGRRGFAQAAAPHPNYPVMVAELGLQWHSTANTIKPFACGIVSHPAIEAAVVLRGQLPAGETIQQVTAIVNPVVVDVMGIRNPEDELHSKFSVYHGVAIGLYDGAAGPPQFDRAHVSDPTVTALRNKIQVVLDDDIAPDEAKLQIEVSDGRRYSHHVVHAKGSRAHPLTREEVRQKATAAARRILAERAELCIELALNVDQAPSVRGLLDAAKPQRVAA